MSYDLFKMDLTNLIQRIRDDSATHVLLSDRFDMILATATATAKLFFRTLRDLASKERIG